VSISVTYYLDVISSWCYWAEPAWAELKQRYANAPVEFDWRIALMDPSGLPSSREQLEWFYRRSGTIARSPFMLNAGWLDLKLKEYIAPNCVAEAGKDFEVTDDRVRLALMDAAMREGKKVGDWKVSAAVAAKAGGMDKAQLLARAKSPEIEKRVRAATTQFHDFKGSLRPSFLIRSNIGDRAVFTGMVKAGPMIATIDTMLDDAAAYASHAAHFGSPPK